MQKQLTEIEKLWGEEGAFLNKLSYFRHRLQLQADLECWGSAHGQSVSVTIY